MKYKFFKKMIKDFVAIYKCDKSRDLALEKAIGGDTVVITSEMGKLIDKMLFDFSEEAGDEYGLIEDLVFEHMLRDNYDKVKGIISFNGEEYEATPKSIFKLIKKSQNLKF